jgi:hypothetical protein
MTTFLASISDHPWQGSIVLERIWVVANVPAYLLLAGYEVGQRGVCHLGSMAQQGSGLISIGSACSLMQKAGYLLLLLLREKSTEHSDKCACFNGMTNDAGSKLLSKVSKTSIILLILHACALQWTRVGLYNGIAFADCPLRTLDKDTNNGTCNCPSQLQSYLIIPYQYLDISAVPVIILKHVSQLKQLTR